MPGRDGAETECVSKTWHFRPEMDHIPPRDRIPFTFTCIRRFRFFGGLQRSSGYE